MYQTIFTIALAMIILAWVIALFTLLVTLRSGKGLAGLRRKRKPDRATPLPTDPAQFPTDLDLPDRPSPD